MSRAEVLQFARSQPLAALATASPEGEPQVAWVFHGVTDAFQLIVGCLRDSRKMMNLARNRMVAMTICEGRRTIQLQGLADRPDRSDLEAARHLMAATQPAFFARFDHREDYLYIRITPTWIRYMDYGMEPTRVIVLGEGGAA